VTSDHFDASKIAWLESVTAPHQFKAYHSLNIDRTEQGKDTKFANR
jgi:hypothetical protein